MPGYEPTVLAAIAVVLAVFAVVVVVVVAVVAVVVALSAAAAVLVAVAANGPAASAIAVLAALPGSATLEPRCPGAWVAMACAAGSAACPRSMYARPAGGCWRLSCIWRN
ncbi:hypothetical protein DL89DRAFT_26191 [Linderina pennispora]|uniref:Uncharacterized protein n=1 Tax=Linderina pennispora TaxID=61395 RepID=A0A1Y1WNS3_9FUNG|nr:uncharacterized protein DL89DRAFT_26191 [Linderina pennispora]ORX75025.1 hypothetical protein DL89DRAFT_26191 [Linderina pennispora]